MAGQDASVVIETTANITYPDAALNIAIAAEQKRQQDELDKKAAELAAKEQADAERLAKEQADAERAAAEERARPVREQLAAVADAVGSVSVDNVPPLYQDRVRSILANASRCIREIEVIE